MSGKRKGMVVDPTVDMEQAKRARGSSIPKKSPDVQEGWFQKFVRELDNDQQGVPYEESNKSKSPYQDPKDPSSYANLPGPAGAGNDLAQRSQEPTGTSIANTEPKEGEESVEEYVLENMFTKTKTQMYKCTSCQYQYSLKSAVKHWWEKHQKTRYLFPGRPMRLYSPENNTRTFPQQMADEYGIAPVETIKYMHRVDELRNTSSPVADDALCWTQEELKEAGWDGTTWDSSTVEHVGGLWECEFCAKLVKAIFKHKKAMHAKPQHSQGIYRCPASTHSECRKAMETSVFEEHMDVHHREFSKDSIKEYKSVVERLFIVDSLNEKGKVSDIDLEIAWKIIGASQDNKQPFYQH